MPKIDVDLVAIEIATLLNHGRRAEAEARVIRQLEQGTAKPATQRIAAQLFGADRGRRSTGPYKWVEIGHENYWMQIEGISHQARLEALADKYARSVKHIEACITLYNKGIEAGRNDP